jgi:3-methyladenine DNA glycosylase/8-oxoguanine DNA glycosylase
VVPGRGG